MGQVADVGIPASQLDYHAMAVLRDAHVQVSTAQLSDDVCPMGSTADGCIQNGGY